MELVGGETPTTVTPVENKDDPLYKDPHSSPCSDSAIDINIVDVEGGNSSDGGQDSDGTDQDVNEDHSGQDEHEKETSLSYNDSDNERASFSRSTASAETDDKRTVSLDDHNEILSTFNNALGSIINERLDIPRIPCVERGCVESEEQYSSDEKSNEQGDDFDDFDEWANGSVKKRYRPTDPEAQGHVSGWAMKYTNNHNKYILKKACIGVIICSNCSDPSFVEESEEHHIDWAPIAIRPAISDKVREKQIGKPCPNPSCMGILVHRKCRGNNGFPVVHLWSDRSDAITFESRGIHDHPRPDTRKIPTEMLELGVDPALVFEAELRLAQQKVTRPRQRRDVTDRTSTCRSTEPQPKNVLTMDVIGCLPDNVQQAIRSFSIKPDKQHITFSFPFMLDILKQMKFREGLPRVHHVTPVLLCDDSLELIEGFQTVITMAPNYQRGCMSIVQLTLWQKGTIEGLRRHFSSLVKVLLDPVAHFSCCRLPVMVVDLKPTDRDQVIQACAETILEFQREHLVKTFPERSTSDIVQMLKDTAVLPYLKSFHEYFYIALNEVGSKLPEQDAARFIALLDHMTSTKCSAYDFKRADLILRDPTLGPPIINEFWMYWGNELASCKVFPVAMAIFDAYKLGNDKTEDGDHGGGCGVTKATLAGFKTSFRRMHIKDGLQNIIHSLKAQNTTGQECLDKETKTSTCGCEACRKDQLKSNDVIHGQGPAVEFLKSLKTATEQGFAKFGLREDLLTQSPFHHHHRSAWPQRPFLCSKPSFQTHADILKYGQIPSHQQQQQQHQLKTAQSLLLPSPTTTPRSPITSKDMFMTSHEHLLTSGQRYILPNMGTIRPNVPMLSMPYALPSILPYSPLLRNTLLSTYAENHSNGGFIGPTRNLHRNHFKPYHPFKL